MGAEQSRRGSAAAGEVAAAAAAAGKAADGSVRRHIASLTDKMTFMSQYGLVTGGEAASDEESGDEEDGDEEDDEDDDEDEEDAAAPREEEQKKAKESPKKKKTSPKKAKEEAKARKRRALATPRRKKGGMLTLSWGAATGRLRRKAGGGGGGKAGGKRDAAGKDAAPAPAPAPRAPDRRASRRGGVIKFEDVQEVQRKRKRDMVVEEIQASEKLYHKFLMILINEFIVPLRERGVLDEAQLRRVFGNIEEIAPFHATLAAELETEEPAAVFLQHADKLRHYTPYVNNYDAACECVASLKRDRNFQQFLEQRRGDEACGGLDLMSFLIMPIQRIPRYRLLLTELQRSTLESDENYAALQRALAKINHTCTFVNEAKRQAENKSRLIEIQNRVAGDYDNLLQPHRMLLREAPILRKKKSSKEVHLFLFSDILMWTSPAPKYLFQGVLNLATATLSDFEHKTKLGFVLESPALEDEGGRLVFVCRNNAHKRLWTDPLKQVLEKCRGFLMRSRNMSDSRRRGRLSQRSSITMTAGTLAAVAQIDEEQAAALAAVNDDAPDAEEQRRASVAAATERLKHLGLDQAGKVDKSLQPKH